MALLMAAESSVLAGTSEVFPQEFCMLLPSTNDQM